MPSTISSIGALLILCRLRRLARELSPRRSRAEPAIEHEHGPPLAFRAGLDRARDRRGRGRVHLGVVRRGDRSGSPGARHLEGVHRARDRRHRRQRGRERRRRPARLEAAIRRRDLGRQELRRPDRSVPLPGARPHLALLRPAADVRVRPASASCSLWRSSSPLSRSGRSPETGRRPCTRGSRSSLRTRCSRRSSGSSSGGSRLPGAYADGVGERGRLIVVSNRGPVVHARDADGRDRRAPWRRRPRDGARQPRRALRRDVDRERD